MKTPSSTAGIGRQCEQKNGLLLLAAAEQRRISDQLWAAQMPAIDYAAICEGIKREV
jgi:hypothetical protein